MLKVRSEKKRGERSMKSLDFTLKQREDLYAREQFTQLLPNNISFQLHAHSAI